MNAATSSSGSDAAVVRDAEPVRPTLNRSSPAPANRASQDHARVRSTTPWVTGRTSNAERGVPRSAQRPSLRSRIDCTRPDQCAAFPATCAS